MSIAAVVHPPAGADCAARHAGQRCRLFTWGALLLVMAMVAGRCSPSSFFLLGRKPRP